MIYLPVGLHIKNEKCLVIGGGKIAARKIKMLLKFGGKVTCLSPEVNSSILRLHKAKKIKLITGIYKKTHIIKGYKLIIAATDNLKVNRQISMRGRKESILVNSVSSRDNSDIIFSAFFKKKNLLVSVSSDGKNCTRAIDARDRIKTYFNS